MTPRRLWLALVVAAFCLPLFLHLGKGDLQNDEAIYSFSVDRIIEIGDWLAPKSSPMEDFPFLEKPPLKPWIVAAPIRLGLLPLNEFSLRVWDALFGSVAFLYIFGIGSILAGPICGAVSVLVFFTYGPLLFEHGLRGNNMEAALLLSYCGGVYHYLRWANLEEGRRRWPHALAVGLYFVLGFMTKFVAAIFLPLVLGVGSVLAKDYGRKLARDWRLWTAVALLTVILIVPWFAYSTWRFGTFFWHQILAEHVYTRFTSYLDPTHLHPWSFYWLNLYVGFANAGSAIVIIVGGLLLLIDTMRRRWPEGTIVMLWFWLPVALISMGTSKLIHYAYPFAPPIAIGAGYLAAYILRVAPGPLDRALWGSGEYASARIPRAIAVFRRPVARMVLVTIAATATVIAITSLLYGQIRLSIRGWVFFKSGGVIRPATIAAVCGVLAGETRRATRAIVPLLVAGLLPLPAYRQAFNRLSEDEHPLRSARDCLLRVESEIGGAARPGLYVDAPVTSMGHPIYYYFRSVRPWKRTESSDPEAFRTYLEDPNQWRPILIWAPHYRYLIRDLNANRGTRPPTFPLMVPFDDILLLLPGPYGVCTPKAFGGNLSG